MSSIAYCSPFVPPEWIVAHGLAPRWLRLGREPHPQRFGAGRAVCPFAAALIDDARALDAQAIIVTTTCDPMRYAAGVVEQQGGPPVFLMNVPSTWQSSAARQLYGDELERLGRFLVRLGGVFAGTTRLASVMLEFDSGRSALRSIRHHVTARQYAEALAGLREHSQPRLPDASRRPPEQGIPVAVVGGPLLEQHWSLLDLVEQAGGRVVLDATEGGERTLPAAFDPLRVQADPLAELGRAYFENIPDVLRRPNEGFYRWFGEELAERRARGILFHRYVWCDTWHAEFARLRDWSPLPVIEVDACDDGASSDRSAARVEALLEMLR